MLLVEGRRRGRGTGEGGREGSRGTGERGREGMIPGLIYYDQVLGPRDNALGTEGCGSRNLK